MSNISNISIIETEDGSSTLVSSNFEGQTYHSDRGAIAESKHVYTRFLKDGDRVLEIGFGSGLNALLSLESGYKLDYTSLELYPIDMDTVRKLSFYNDSLEKMHISPWGEWINITENFRLRKIDTDITKPESIPSYNDIYNSEDWDHRQLRGHLHAQLQCWYDIVFFDAFSPSVVPEQWTDEIFRRIAQLLRPGAMLLTYSAKGDVKRALRSAGFTVKRLQGALGKHNMVQAIFPSMCDE